ncbi:MAG: S9 family peptidase [Bacteroidales bacterium]|nr:S9 family peptidase [Bacteroidales bacterium]
MKSILKLNIILCIAMSSTCNSEVKPPEAEKIPKEFTEFETTRTDNYYWMRERKNPKVTEYLKQENDYFENSFLKKNKKLNDKILSELKSRISEEEKTAPYFENGYYYYSRYEKDKDYEIFCRKKDLDTAEEEILLNVNDLAKRYDYCDADVVCISPNNLTMAYAVDTVSRRRYEIRFKNIKDSVDIPGKIPDTDGDLVFANDSRTTFYVSKETSTLRAFKVFRHIVGMDCSNDKEIFYEDDPMFELSVERSKSDEYIIINHNSTTTSEVRLIPCSNPYTDPVVFRKREKGLEYYVDHCNGKFYIRTNEKGKNFCIMTCDSVSYNKNWNVLVPHRDSVLIQDFEVFNNYLVLEEMREGLVKYEIFDLNTMKSHLLDFGQETYAAWTGYNPEADSKFFRYGYSSFNTPNSVIHYDLSTHEKTVVKEDSVPNFDKNNYDVKRIFVSVRDGAKVPVSMLYKKGTDLQGNNFCLQYAYGSYGMSEEDNFFRSIFPLIDRGFVFVLAHIRGGSEMGYSWYEDGKLLKKKNTFNDFVDVSKYLIGEGYTSEEKLFAMGGSAGGLLMGAIINSDPSLYKGIIAQVPFVDVVTTMLDENIPLTTGEYEEWGDPREKEYYDYILSYSPYDNIKEQDYPAMLVTAGLHDSQVQYWEPAKWVAKLREMKTDNNPLYLKTNMKAGHSGSSGRFESQKETAEVYTFILKIAGFKD